MEGYQGGPQDERASLGDNNSDILSVKDANTREHSTYAVFAQLSSKAKYVELSLN
jgi:hypothetical protein